MTTPEAAFQEQKMIQLTLQMPEGPVVNFDNLKAGFLKPLKDFVNRSGAGDLSFDYQNSEMIGVSLSINNTPDRNIDFYLDGTVRPDDGVALASNDWIAAAQFIATEIAAAIQQGQKAGTQLAKLEKAIKAMTDALSAEA